MTIFKKRFYLLVLLLAVSVFSANANQLVGLDGDEVDYQEFSSSGNVILFIWTTWCPYCLIQLDNIAKQCSYHGIELVLVNSGEKQRIVENFIEREDIPECVTDNIILDRKSAVAKKFSVSGFPTFIFLKDGKYLTRSYYLNNDLIERVY
jgi:thiol-disulfide isomerase/thioredoxin